MAGKVWLVTGCSTGLGRALITAILRRGDRAIATARRLSAIQDLGDAGAAAIQLDIAASQDELNAKATEAVGVYGHVDFIVNNAGYQSMGSIEDTTPEMMQAQFATNFFGPINFTRAMLRHLRERKQGTLVFMNSTGRWHAYSHLGAYAASKAALNAAVESLAMELTPAGIKVLSLEPGVFASDIVAEHRRATLFPPTEHHVQHTQILESYVLPSIRANPVVDVTKLADLIIDLVKGEGAATGKEIALLHPLPPQEFFAGGGMNFIPQTLPIGSDSLAFSKGKAEMWLRNLEQWKDLIVSADVAGDTATLMQLDNGPKTSK